MESLCHWPEFQFQQSENDGDRAGATYRLVHAQYPTSEDFDGTDLPGF